MTFTADHKSPPQGFNGHDVSVKRCIIRDFRIDYIAAVGNNGEQIVIMERKAA